MNLWQNYFHPHTLSEALTSLEEAPRPVAPIAGGTDLLLDLAQGRRPEISSLVDLTAVVELNALEIRAETLFIGAAVPLARIAESTVVARHALALAEACELIGGPQVRNVASLGGNVAHALPAADGTIALMALDAVVEVASLEGSRQWPLKDLFQGPGQSTLRAGRDLIVGFALPLRTTSEGSAFKRIMRPQGVALPILNAAAWMKRSGDVVRSARLAVGPLGPTPQRMSQAESALINRPFSRTSAEQAAAALLAGAAFRPSPRRGSAEYRRLLVENLLPELLETCWERACQ